MLKDLTIRHEIILIKTKSRNWLKAPAADDNEIDNTINENTIVGLKDVVFIFQESLPEKDEKYFHPFLLRSSALKDFELIINNQKQSSRGVL